MRVLITRPEADARRTAARLRALGHEVVGSPVLSVQPIADAEFRPGPWEAVLITSANAARAIAAHPRRSEVLACRLIAVGRRSAEAAAEAGFAEVACADGDESDLVRYVAAQFAESPARFLYLAGTDLAADLAGDLVRRGLAVETVVIYRAAPAERLTPAAHAALSQGAIDAVLHYSQRSAEAFVELCRTAGLLEPALNTCHCCLSEPIASVLARAGAKCIRVAKKPDESTLVALLDG